MKSKDTLHDVTIHAHCTIQDEFLCVWDCCSMVRMDSRSRGWCSFLWCGVRRRSTVRARATTTLGDAKMSDAGLRCSLLTEKMHLTALLSGVTGERLREAFRTVLLRQEEKTDPVRSAFGTIRREPIRLADKVTLIRRFCRDQGRFTFSELISEQNTKTDAVVTFLACLELIKIGFLTVEQEDVFSEIELTWNPESQAELTNEDLMQYE